MHGDIIHLAFGLIMFYQFGRLIEEFFSTAFKAHPYGEPVVGHMSDLQSFTRAEAMAFFEKYYGANNLTIVIVEHEMGVIERITNRCVVLNFGQKICEGTYQEVSQDHQVQEAYLGIE